MNKKKTAATEMVTPVMEISAGQNAEPNLTTATVPNRNKKQQAAPEASQASENDDPDSHILTFPSGRLTLTGEQNKALGEFVKNGRERRKKFEIVAYAEPQAPGTAAEQHMKKVMDAKRRAQATSVFLRLHGVKPATVAVRTEDEGGARPGDVKIILK